MVDHDPVPVRGEIEIEGDLVQEIIRHAEQYGMPASEYVRKAIKLAFMLDNMNTSDSQYDVVVRSITTGRERKLILSDMRA